jgi:hypothetical protein
MTAGKSNLFAFACCAGFAATSAGCTGDNPSEVSTLPIVGTWIRVYPPEAALDTLIIHADGTLTGGDAVFEPASFAYTHWRIGCSANPGALAVGAGPVGKDRPLGTKRQVWCHPFWILGDTLLLADTKNTTFLRAPVQGGSTTVTAWERPRGNFAVPEIGESVRVAPPVRDFKRVPEPAPSP